MNVRTAARLSTELTSGFGRAIAEPSRAMAMVVREKRILTEVYVVVSEGMREEVFVVLPAV